ncbi:Glutamate-1-semialdehyde 2,1-aminomutase, chloroplastic [Vitis vinifera]|uniref:Glutamate-1-semialdehyde 2,1-aminomutase, chloroplastic n=1 Tax=Vitis vinifera TaxID=29760 RepID=A0A438EXV4_VITVI|nr:Glutamate-1-semialdehyde 2,1-aminomutase, chloroplastic [Vitis vinifera]
MASVSGGVALSCPSRLSHRSSSSSHRRHVSSSSVKMAVSVDEKKKSFTLRKSEEAFEIAKELMPGGVNSPVRAFKSVGGQPILFDSVKGSHMWDIDGNEYIDYVGSWGPAIIGHADDEVPFLFPVFLIQIYHGISINVVYGIS